MTVLAEGTRASNIGRLPCPATRVSASGRVPDGQVQSRSNPMAKPPMIDEGDEPVELNIGLDKIQDIVLKAREFDQEDFPDDPDPGGDAEAAEDREERLDEGDDPTEAELRALIDD